MTITITLSRVPAADALAIEQHAETLAGLCRALAGCDAVVETAKEYVRKSGPGKVVEWRRSGCMKAVCVCHDDTAMPYSCTHCGCTWQTRTREAARG